MPKPYNVENLKNKENTIGHRDSMFFNRAYFINFANIFILT